MRKSKPSKKSRLSFENSPEVSGERENTRRINLETPQAETVLNPVSKLTYRRPCICLLGGDKDGQTDDIEKAKNLAKKLSAKASIRIEEWSPTQEVILNPQVMREGLAAVFAEGDRKAIIEILQSWISALNSVESVSI